MPNNRHTIDDLALCLPPQIVQRGALGLRPFVVPEGFAAVMSEGGAFKEVLLPGQHRLRDYAFGREIQARLVSTRVQLLDLLSYQELQIARPAPVFVELELSVEYCVDEPRRLLASSRPLSALWDAVMAAARVALPAFCSEDLRHGGAMLQRSILVQLDVGRLRERYGLAVVGLLVRGARPTSAGADAIGGAELSAFLDQHEARSAIHTQLIASAGVQLTPEWMIANARQFYEQSQARQADLISKVMEYGLATSGDIASVLRGNAAQPWGLASKAPGTRSLPDRISEELRFIQSLPATVEPCDQHADDDGPAGSYDLLVRVPRSVGGSLEIFIHCPPGYPTLPPVVEVALDGYAQPFVANALATWRGSSYLVDIVREARQFFG